jgi:mannosyl-oligosaccharide alpha-1,2-mannosidase
LRWYLESIIGINKYLLTKWKIPNTNKYLLFPAEIYNNQKQNKFGHLTCFVPGMLALGVDQLTDQEIEAQSQGFTEEEKKYISRENMLNVAISLLETCVYLYQIQPTKLAPDIVLFEEDQLSIVDFSYLLRPETIESLYILYRVTKDEKYLEQGWEIFKAIEKNCRTPTAYTGLLNVETGEQNNSMQSFFLAETLKYLYLLFSDNRLYPFSEWVFTTEAHLFRIHK